jgi:hypothetical protein
MKHGGELRAQGYLAMPGQLVDASIVAAPNPCNTEEGQVPEHWRRQPATLRHKDRDDRWTVKTTKAKPREGETHMVDLAIPAFGYQNQVSANRRHRPRTRAPCQAERHDRRQGELRRQGVDVHPGPQLRRSIRVVISDHTRLMDKAGGWNKDMAQAEVFFGRWSSPTKATPGPPTSTSTERRPN